eukprot:1161230-Pelagomonas_calceolata.AAC.6
MRLSTSAQKTFRLPDDLWHHSAPHMISRNKGNPGTLSIFEGHLLSSPAQGNPQPLVLKVLTLEHILSSTSGPYPLEAIPTHSRS